MTIIDFVQGVAVNSLGHCPGVLRRALKKQSRRLIHISNYFYNPKQLLLAKKLAKLYNSAVERANRFQQNKPDESQNSLQAIGYKDYKNILSKYSFKAAGVNINGNPDAFLKKDNNVLLKPDFILKQMENSSQGASDGVLLQSDKIGAKNGDAKYYEHNNSRETSIFFTNSGTESLECAFKAVRAYGNKRDKYKVFALKHSFHGRSFGSLSLTYKPEIKSSFAPLYEVEYLEPNNLEDLEKIDENTAGLFLEPIQGEAGVFPLNEDFICKAREITSKNNSLLVFDEVQTGIGRTGKIFAFEYFGIAPDIVCLAKGLGGGVPVGAVIFAPEFSDIFKAGEHGSTFAGNPLACSASLNVLETIEKENILKNVNKQGAKITEFLVDTFGNARGKGLLLAFDIENAKKFADLAFENGLFLNIVRDNSIRLMPSLNIKDKEVEQFKKIMRKTYYDYKNI